MPNTYRIKLAELKARLGNGAGIRSKQQLNAFAFFSANLTNFMPAIPYAEHGKLFRQATLNRQWNALDQQFFKREHPFQLNGWDEDLPVRLNEKPGIICTFHTGSYRLINYLLHRAAVPLAVLIGEQAQREQGAFIRQLVTDFRRVGRPTPLDILSANDPKILFNIKTQLQMGKSVVTYMDGYQGAQALNRENTVRLDFLAQHQLVRKGIPYMAYRFNVPIYPVMCFRDSDEQLRFICLDAIERQEMPLHLFIEFAIMKIYGAFAAYLQHYPAQWQNWSTLHLYAQHSDFHFPKSNHPVRTFAQPRPESHALLALGDEFFLLDKTSYRAFELKEKTYRELYGEWYA